jgi:hypothetical protein
LGSVLAPLGRQVLGQKHPQVPGGAGFGSEKSTAGLEADGAFLDGAFLDGAFVDGAFLAGRVHRRRSASTAFGLRPLAPKLVQPPCRAWAKAGSWWNRAWGLALGTPTTTARPATGQA